MRARLCGEMTNNGWARLYRMFGFDVCCPNDVREAVESCPEGEELVFEINSGGGSVYAGFEMYSVIRGRKGRTVAEVQSMAGSAASVAMAACDTVLMSPVAEVMVHRASAGAYGNSAVMRQARQMLDTIDESILNAYLEKSGGRTDREGFRRMMREETFMTAQQAVDCGLADGILGDGDGAATAPLAAPAAACASACTGGLPPIEDLLQIARASGISLGADGTLAGDSIGFRGSRKEDAMGEEALRDASMGNEALGAVAVGGSPGTGADTGETNRIDTVEALRAAYPGLTRQIETAARQEAEAAERERIQGIEDIAPAGLLELARDAKFANPLSPDAFAVAVLRAQKARGERYLEAARADAASSGANAVAQAAAADDAADEFLDAIRAQGRK